MIFPPLPYYLFPYQPVPRQYPEANVPRMQASARAYQQLIPQAENLTAKIQSDAGFDRRLNQAAQVNHQDEVKRLVGTVVQAPFHVSYTPDGLKVEIYPQNQQACTILTVYVCW
ncbi:MAG TPA: hypothetical protein VFK33_17620 [Bacillales bacterium]|nr:hypothetical protein [Bacillales bacterium]